MRKRILILCLLLPWIALAQTTLTVDDIEVSARSFFDHEVFHGYADYRFMVKNLSTTKAHQIQVELQGSPYASLIGKTVEIPPGSQIAFPMYRGRGSAHQSLIVTVDRRHSEEIILQQDRSSDPWHTPKVSLLASKSVNQDDLQKEIENLRGWLTSSDFEEEYTIRRTDRPPQEWSDHWLTYSSFDGVLLHQSDVEKMSPNILKALQHYVECGGVLTVLEGSACPFPGPRNQSIDSSLNRHTYAIGFGRCYVHPRTGGNEFLMEDHSAWVETRDTFNLNRNETSINELFPIVDNMAIPVRGFLLLVTLFALLAGPVTVFTLAKSNRRIWLLWIIPLESLVVCGLVLLYSLFSEGITPTVRLNSLTLLDQTEHRATTLGWAGYYCPQRPSAGLFIPGDWEWQQVKQLHWNSAGTATDWTYGQHLSRGWIQARVPTFFMCRQNTIRRERLVVSATETGALEAVNGLGAEIDSLWLRDAEGQFHHAGQIAAGQRMTLTPESGKQGTANLKMLRGLFSNDYFEAKLGLAETPHLYMIPGSYVAVLNGTPFMEHGLGDEKINLNARGVVYGILEREEAP